MVPDRTSRRQAVKTAGLIGITALAGCVAGGRSGGTPSQEANADSSHNTPSGTPTPTVEIDDIGLVDEFPRYEAGYDTIELGSRSSVADRDENRPHELLIWNPANVARDISVTISGSDEAVNAQSLDESFAVPADDLLTIRLLEPASYRISVTAQDEGAKATFVIPRSRFDCNDSHHEITVSSRGTIAHIVYSTAMDCDASQ